MNSKLDGQPLNFLLCYWQTKGKKTKDNLILNFTYILYSLYYWLHFVHIVLYMYTLYCVTDKQKVKNQRQPYLEFSLIYCTACVADSILYT